MFRPSMISLTIATLLAQGCSGGADDAPLLAAAEPLDLRQPEQVRDAAQQSDPLSILLFATMPIGVLTTEEQPTTCPRMIDESDLAAGIVKWRIEGDCEGENAAGRYRVEGSIVGRGDLGETVVEYRGYRQVSQDASGCAGQEEHVAADGVLRLPQPYAPLAPDEEFEEPPLDPDFYGERRYDIDLRIELTSVDSESCFAARTEVAFDVAIDRTFAPPDAPDTERDLSDIRGRVAVLEQTRASGQEEWQTARSGAWRVSAEDYGSADGEGECSSYVTGTMRIESGGDTAVLTPSAPASCLTEGQENACTAWTLNGEPQPELCDFVGLSGCSAGPDAPPPWAAVVLLVGGLIWQQRRRRRAC